MSPRKFLLMQLAASAAMLAHTARHAAEAHGENEPSDECAEKVTDVFIEVGETFKAALNNDALPPFSREYVEEVRHDVRRTLTNKALAYALAGQLVGFVKLET